MSSGSVPPPHIDQGQGQRKWQQVDANFDQQQFTQPMDQFDQYFYKSTHIHSDIGQQLESSSGLPPEVNIEVPSDSDSSRRPSKYTLSNASSCHDISIDGGSAAAVVAAGGGPGQGGPPTGRLGLNKGAIAKNNFHQNVDRRSSGGGGIGSSSRLNSGIIFMIFFYFLHRILILGAVHKLR